MRGTHTRKRSRPQTGRPFKRRKVTRRRRRGGKSIAFTSQNGGGRQLGFKSRRVSGRRMRNILWRDTMAKQHYRSNMAAGNTITTFTNTNLMSCIFAEALNLSGFFYSSAGGAINPDSATALPTFHNDIIIRGGKIGIRVCNELDTTAANAGTINGVAYLIRSSKNFNGSSVPVSAFVGWDPTLVTDFDTDIGKVIYRKQFLLRDADVMDIEYRLRVERIDVADYSNNFNQLIWIIMAGSIDSPIAHTVRCTFYYNLSFTGDAVT